MNKVVKDDNQKSLNIYTSDLDLLVRLVGKVVTESGLEFSAEQIAEYLTPDGFKTDLNWDILSDQSVVVTVKMNYEFFDDVPDDVSLEYDFGLELATENPQLIALLESMAKKVASAPASATSTPGGPDDETLQKLDAMIQAEQGSGTGGIASTPSTTVPRFEPPRPKQ